MFVACLFFFFKQKTAYEMRISDWSSDVCSSDLGDVGWYVSRIADVNQADRVAAAIDALSQNSDHETKTMTEQAATANWMKKMADIGLIVGSIMGEVFFTLLLLNGNNMAQAVRESIQALAVLKTLGFRDGAG